MSAIVFQKPPMPPDENDDFAKPLRFSISSPQSPRHCSVCRYRDNALPDSVLQLSGVRKTKPEPAARLDDDKTQSSKTQKLHHSRSAINSPSRNLVQITKEQN